MRVRSRGGFSACSMDTTIFDLIIVGGGLAGCATGLALSKHNQTPSFIILDDADPSAFKIGESLPPESSRLLHYLHPSLPDRLEADIASGSHLLCTGNASIWASSVLEERHAIMNPFGHGFHLNRAAFDQLLRNIVQVDNPASTQSNDRVVRGRFKGVQKNSATDWAVHAEVDSGPTTFYARWLVDATGRKASLATKLGAQIITSDPLLAFYAVFTGPSFLDSPDVDNDHRTIIEATADGWFYSALLSRDPSTRVVAFHTLPTHPSAKRARRRAGFLDLMRGSAPHISSIIEMNGYEVMPGGFPRCTAAGSTHLDRACDVKNRWIAVGDAAMAFDPLSSQGMMTALELGCYVGASLARLINGEEQESEPIEEVYRKTREDYERKRSYYYGLVKRFHDQEFWSNVVALSN